tara:strand:- start:333 stop:1211 length:879 start_codon:yes stop_codon:yes gene_type:complete
MSGLFLKRLKFFLSSALTASMGAGACRWKGAGVRVGGGGSMSMNAATGCSWVNGVALMWAMAVVVVVAVASRGMDRPVYRRCARWWVRESPTMRPFIFSGIRCASLVAGVCVLRLVEGGVEVKEANELLERWKAHTGQPHYLGVGKFVDSGGFASIWPPWGNQHVLAENGVGDGQDPFGGSIDAAYHRVKGVADPHDEDERMKSFSASELSTVLSALKDGVVPVLSDAEIKEKKLNYAIGLDNLDANYRQENWDGHQLPTDEAGIIEAREFEEEAYNANQQLSREIIGDAGY